ncbi:MAG TPA: MFS transporter [Actinomycetota bacterium]|nr:MFS transporter [Actinomycetota bacterium]
MARAEASVQERLLTPLFLRIIFCTFAYFTALGIVIPVLPLYVKGPLSGGNFSVGVTLAMFSLSAVLLRPIAGRIGDQHGRRLIIVGGCAAVAASFAGYVAADSLPLLYAARVVTGLGEAFFFVGAAAAVQDLAPDHRRGEAMSYFSLGLYGGLAVGPPLGEALLRDTHFSEVWLAAAAAPAMGAVAALWVPDTRPAVRGGPGKLINRAGLLPGAVLLASVWGLASFTAFLPLYSREIGLKGSGTIFLAYSLVVLLLRSAGARIPDRLGFTKSIVLSMIASGSGLLTMGLWAAPAGLYLGAVLFALGQGLAFPALMAMAIASAPESERGSVVGTVGMFFDVAIGVGALTAGAIASRLGYSGALIAAAAGAGAGLALMAGRSMRGPGGEPPVASRDS